MVASVHPCKSGHRHVTGDALARLAFRVMVRVRSRVLHLVLVAGHAGIIELFLFEPVASAGGMAVHTVEPARFRAGAHAPRGQCVIFANIPAVRVKVRVLQGDEVEVIKEPFTGFILD